MHTHNENIWILRRQELQEFNLRQLRADVRRESGQHRWRESSDAGCDPENCGVRWVRGWEEGFCCCHCAFDIGLVRGISLAGRCVPILGF